MSEPIKNNPVSSTNPNQAYISGHGDIKASKKLAYVHYTKPAIYSQGNKWHIYFMYRHEDTKRMIRIRKYGLLKGGGINRIKDLRERREFAEYLKQAWLESLQEGYVPKECRSTENMKPIKTWTMNQALNYWKQESIEVGNRKKTIQTYGIIINHLKSNNPLSSYTAENIQNKLRTLKATNNLSGTTYNNYLRFIKTFFNFCVNKKIIETSPATSLKTIAATVTKHQYFPDELFSKIKAYALLRYPELYRFMEFMYNTGLRPGEVRQMKYKYLMIDRLLVPGNISKNKKEEFVPLDKEYAQSLQGDPEALIFGRGSNYFGSLFAKLKKEMGLPKECDLYSLRHTRAISLARSNVSPYAIMSFLRHSSLEMTQKYLRQMGLEIDREAIEKGKAF